MSHFAICYVKCNIDAFAILTLQKNEW